MDGSPQKCKHARCSATLKRGGKNNGYCRAHAESATTSDCFTEADRALLNTLAADLKFHSSGLNKEMKSITAVIKPFLTYMQKSATKMSQLQKENNNNNGFLVGAFFTGLVPLCEVESQDVGACAQSAGNYIG